MSKTLIIDTLDTSKNCLPVIDIDEKCNTSGGSRTPNPRFRRPMLYPIELRTPVVLGLIAEPPFRVNIFIFELQGLILLGGWCYLQLFRFCKYLGWFRLL